MTYRIEGLKRADFAPLFAMSEAELAEKGAVRVLPLSPCGRGWREATGEGRVASAAQKATLLPVAAETGHKLSTSQAPFGAQRRAAPSPALRAPSPARGEGLVWALFADDAIAYIHAHNAAHGCFSARIERD
jgi:hypothetical protein